MELFDDSLNKALNQLKYAYGQQEKEKLLTLEKPLILYRFKGFKVMLNQN